MGFGGVGIKQVSSEYIADNTIISVNVGSIVGSDIAYGTLGNVKIGGSRITYGTIPTASARIGSLTAARMTYGTVPSASLRIGSITAANINYGTLGNVKIGGSRITYGTIPTASARIGSLSANLGYGTIPKVASDNVKYSNDAEASTDSGTLVLMKSITIPHNIKGTIRISFNLKTSSAYAASAQIYRNGVAIGTLRSTNSLSYTPFTEDITLDWNAGDTCELWGGIYSGWCSVNNFRIAYDSKTDIGSTSVYSSNIGSVTGAKITYGTLGNVKIGGSRITYGTIPTASARIGSVSAARITYGTFGSGKISGAAITYGSINADRLPASSGGGGYYRQFWQRQGNVVRGTWVWTADAGQTDYSSVNAEGAGYWRTNTSNNLDEYKWPDIYLTSGNYKITLLTVKSAAWGIIEILHGNTRLGTYNCYGAATTYNHKGTLTFSIGSATTADMRFRSNGKHGSASAYTIAFSRLQLERTA